MMHHLISCYDHALITQFTRDLQLAPCRLSQSESEVKGGGFIYTLTYGGNTKGSFIIYRGGQTKTHAEKCKVYIRQALLFMVWGDTIKAHTCRPI